MLVEAIASGPTPAWDAYDWAVASAGPWRWPALVDAVTRGILRRRHDLALPLAVTWTAQCLPYYDEAYNSVTRFGQFLHDVAALAPDEDLSAIERIIVEVDRVDQIEPALDAGATHLLLDNMDPPTLRGAVRLVGGRVPTEASGGVTLETIRAIAETGVTYISVGRLTQSAPAADIGLDFASA